MDNFIHAPISGVVDRKIDSLVNSFDSSNVRGGSGIIGLWIFMIPVLFPSMIRDSFKNAIRYS